MATSIARTSDGHVNCFFANFAGLRGGENPVQTPQEGVKVTLNAKLGTKGFFLPFLGDAQACAGRAARRFASRSLYLRLPGERCSGSSPKGT